MSLPRNLGPTPYLFAAAALVVAGCTRSKPVVPPPGESARSTTAVQQPGAAPVDKPPLARAQASVAPLGASKVVGTLMFVALQDGAGVRIQGALSGLTPGRHGVHVHQHPDCSGADGAAAGGHFNPTQAPHGAIEDAHSHVGDLGNLVADAEGRATVDVVKKAATLGDGGPADMLGHSVIVHADADDLHSQPAGASGARIACGVVEKI